MNKKLHLLVYGHAFPNQVEPGRGIFVMQLLSALPDDIDLRVVAPVPWFLNHRRGKPNSVIPLKESVVIGSQNVTVYRPRFLLLPANLLRPVIGWLEFVTTYRTVKRIQSEWRIDIVHVNFAFPDGIACRLICQALHLQYIITEHMGAIGNLLSKPSLKSQLVQVYQSAKKTIAVSQTIQAELQSRMRKNTPIMLIPNGIDTSKYQLIAKRNRLEKIIFIGNLIVTKGIQVLIKALADLQQKGYNPELIIVGEGKYKQDLQKLVSKLNLENQVCFLGWKSPEEIEDLLCKSDLLVLPSFRESFGIVLIEAMACGLPVLSTLCGGPEEIVTSETGLLVAADDVGALSTGLEYMIEHIEDYQPATIQMYCHKHFDRKNIVSSLVTEYRKASLPAKVCHFTSAHVRTDVRILVKQCQGLVDAGYKVHLVVADGKGDTTWNGVRIHDIGSSPNRLIRMVKNPLIMLFKIISLRCAVYHFHDPELLPVAYLLKKFTSAKVIYDAHEDYFGEFLTKPYLPKISRPWLAKAIRFLESAVGSKMDYVITATDHIHNLLQYINPHMITINNYPKLSEWSSFTRDCDEKTGRSICYIGSITEVRGVTTIIRALEQVDCILLLAGGFEFASYRDELIKLPGWQKVRELGYVSRQQVTEIISRSRVGLVTFLPEPNHVNALSTKLFEYMAGGIAVLASDFPAWKKLIEDSGCGICVDPLSTTQISQALNYMLDNPQETSDMGQIGRNLTMSVYNWETQITDLLSVYRVLLSE